jgi:FixJ family two-component response regulator
MSGSHEPVCERLFRYRRADIHALTPGERGVLEMVAKHGSQAKAAAATGMPRVNINRRFDTIRSKLGVTTTAEAIELFKRGGL